MISTYLSYLFRSWNLGPSSPSLLHMLSPAPTLHFWPYILGRRKEEDSLSSIHTHRPRAFHHPRASTSTTHPSTDIRLPIIADSELDHAKLGAYILPLASTSASMSTSNSTYQTLELGNSPHTALQIYSLGFHPYRLAYPPSPQLHTAHHPLLLSTQTYAAYQTLSLAPSPLRTNPNPSPI